MCVCVLQRIPLLHETFKGMKKGKTKDEQSGREEFVENQKEEEGEGEGEEGGMHEFKDESGGLFCALYIPDADRYGHGPHPTVISVYGGDFIRKSYAILPISVICNFIPSCVILSYPILFYPILSYPILSYPILSYDILFPLLDSFPNIRSISFLSFYCSYFLFNSLLNILFLSCFHSILYCCRLYFTFVLSPSLWLALVFAHVPCVFTFSYLLTI